MFIYKSEHYILLQVNVIDFCPSHGAALIFQKNPKATIYRLSPFLSKHAQIFTGYSFSNVICWFFNIKVHWMSLGFELLIGQNKRYLDV